MARQIEISASFTGTVSTGSYENEKPFYSVKESFDVEDGDEINVIDANIVLRQKQLQDICYNQFKKQAEVSYAEKIAKQYRNMRFYDGKDGLKYPSVTSIIGWDADFHVSPDELSQYASRGTIIHKQVELFLKTGEWVEPRDIPEIYPDLVIVKQGNLGLELDNVDFPAFYEKYPFKVIETEKTVLNHDLRYGGRLDIKCIIKSSQKASWDKVAGLIYDVPTILDVKTGSIDKTKCFKQQTAYWECEPDVQQVGIIHLNKEVKQGYSKPIIETNKEKYKALFIKDRENFKQRYGI